MAKSTEAKGPVKSLVEFMQDKRRADCPVCKLPEDVRKQLATAAEKGIRRKDVLEWLRAVIGVQITDVELTAHRNGRHDE
jgi:hypothetical protein